MFLHGHELHRVVAGFGDARQDGGGEFAVGVHARFLAGHADVGFVNQRRADGRRVECMLPLIGHRRVPDLAAIILRRGILHRAADARRDAVAARAVGPDDVQFDALAVGEGVGRELELPDSAGKRVQGMGLAVPGVEVADEGHGLGGGSPLAHRPFVGEGIAMNAGVVVAGGMSGERAGMFFDGGEFRGQARHPAFDGALVRFEPRIIGHELRLRCHCVADWRVPLPAQSQIQPLWPAGGQRADPGVFAVLCLAKDAGLPHPLWLSRS